MRCQMRGCEMRRERESEREWFGGKEKAKEGGSLITPRSCL